MAETDLGAAGVLDQTDGDCGDVVCFHCQQAVEKMLKAAMFAADLDPPQTHDLVYLLVTLGAVRRIPAGLEEICTQLADLGVAPRYPGWSVDSLQLDPHQVLESARLASRCCILSLPPKRLKGTPARGLTRPPPE